ncbi:MAG: hypothetical protein Q4F95_11030 [Oscillospiraceae bacterium]|nr:hypothetical protein [Oscillospiraceae bacterium]
MVKYRQHKIRAVTYFFRNLWLLIIPVIRSLRNIKPDIDGILSWMRWAWPDIVMILLILGAGIVRWYCTYIITQGNKIIFAEGVFIRRRSVICDDYISCITLESGIFYRIAGAVSLRADMPGRHGKKAVKFVIRRKDLAEFDMTIKNSQLIYRSNWKSIFRYSLFFSNAFSGFSYIAVLIYHTGTLTLSEALGYFGFSPSVAVSIFALCWVLSFIRNMLIHINFKVHRVKSTYIVTSGLIFRKKAIFKEEDFIFFENVNGLVSNMAGYASMYASIRGHRQLLMPLIRVGKVPTSRYFRPRSIFAYIWKSVVLMLLLGVFTQNDYQIVVVWAVLLLIPAGWLLISDITSFRESGIGSESISYSSIYNFYTVFFNNRSIKKVRILSNPVQRMRKMYNAGLYLKNSGHYMTVRSGKFY